MALKDVNLVPDRVLQQRYRTRRLSLWAGAYALLLACLLGAYAENMRKSMGRRPPADALPEARKALAASYASIESFKGELDRLTFVRQVAQSRGLSDALSAIDPLLGPEAWLTALSYEVKTEGAAMLVANGVISSTAILGKLLRNLETSGAFNRVVLKSAGAAMDPAAGPEAAAARTAFVVELNVNNH